MARNMRVIPIRSYPPISDQQREIAGLAYEYWLARFGVLEGSPEDDFYRAQREVMARHSRPRTTAAVLFLVRRSDS
jgi:hypothetical protein